MLSTISFRLLVEATSLSYFALNSLSNLISNFFEIVFGKNQNRSNTLAELFEVCNRTFEEHF
jgi:hypothetical protein